MGETLLIASAVSSVIGAVGSIAQGHAASRAAEAEAEQYRDEAEAARVNAVIEETDRRKELQQILATGEAVRAGRGLSLDTGSSEALRDSSEAEAERDINLIRANAFGRQRRMLLAADAASARSGTALTSGYLRVGSQLLSAAGSGYEAYTYSKLPKGGGGGAKNADAQRGPGFGPYGAGGFRPY